MSDSTPTPAAERQCATAVMMIRPVAFQSNPQTAASNEFQRINIAPPPAEAQALAANEFDGLTKSLSDAGIEVLAFDDLVEPHTPDAIFPNNWVSFHADGTVVLYPMQAENRRLERRHDIIDRGLGVAGFEVREIVDLSGAESDGRFLEGTGSLVLDRVTRIAYACLSPRTDAGLAAEFGARLGYRIVSFRAAGADGQAIYHTNVMMAVGERLAVVCGESIPDQVERDHVMQSLGRSGREVIDISLEQMNRFAGNVMELENQAGEKILAMSAAARDAFTAAQHRQISRHAQVVAAPIDTIELCAGGSVRCMLAEMHLPRKSQE